MEEIVKINNNEIEASTGNYGLVELTEGMLAEARASISNNSNTLSVPITELSILGASVSYSGIKHCDTNDYDSHRWTLSISQCGCWGCFEDC